MVWSSALWLIYCRFYFSELISIWWYFAKRAFESDHVGYLHDKRLRHGRRQWLRTSHSILCSRYKSVSIAHCHHRTSTCAKVVYFLVKQAMRPDYILLGSLGANIGWNRQLTRQASPIELKTCEDTCVTSERKDSEEDTNLLWSLIVTTLPSHVSNWFFCVSKVLSQLFTNRHVAKLIIWVRLQYFGRYDDFVWKGFACNITDEY